MARALVVVTTYERPHYLARALEGWRRQTARDLVLAVADDGSGPETADLVRAFAASAPFRVVHVRQEHAGYRRARILNEAVRAVPEGDLVLFTDGDCVPPADFLAGHLAVHGPRTFAVGGAYRLEEAPSARLTVEDVARGGHEALRTPSEIADLRRRARKSRLGLWLRLPRRPKVLGLNVGVDRALFEEVNGYDEAFVGYGLEDSDLRDRLMRTRPRPTVRVLYGAVDTFHVWHPRTAPGERVNAPYYRTRRPLRCAHGLVAEGPAAGSAQGSERSRPGATSADA